MATPNTGTLLLRLVGPMQSWGYGPATSTRTTAKEPTKSGIVGLLGAALGRDRKEPISDLARLRLAVRADREGVLVVDYGATKSYRASGSNTLAGVEIWKHFLSDAAFLIGLYGDLHLLEQLDAALLDPFWPLALGRKSCFASLPIWIDGGLLPGTTLEDAIHSYPLLVAPTSDTVRVVLDDPRGVERRSDYPLSFAPRRYGPRWVSTMLLPASDMPVTADLLSETERV